MTAGGVQTVQRVASALVDLSDGTAGNASVRAILARLAAHAVDLLTSTDAAGVIALGDGTVSDLAAPPAVQRLLTLQIEADDGPSVQCFRTGQPIHAWRPDTETRPGSAFDAACLQAGFGCVHAVPMRTRNDSIGSLTLFQSTPGVLDPTDAAVAQALADTVAVHVRHRRTVEWYEARVAQLQQALDSRVLIEQAKGVIAERAAISPDDAFAVIRGYARRNGLQLHDVARLIVDRVIDLSGGE